MSAESPFLEAPRWPQQAGRRLRISLLLSTICVTTVVMVLRFPVVEQTGPVAEMLVRILLEEAAPAVAPTVTEHVEEAVADESTVSPALATGNLTSGEATETRDWHAMIPDAAQAALDNAPRAYEVNPVFAEQRRHAAVQFRPGKAPRRTPVWENVEKDAMGRSVLWSGDCYRVIDDPNVGSREAFETFGQYITHCMNWKDSPKELPWVSEIRSRRASQARSGPRAAE